MTTSLDPIAAESHYDPVPALASTTNVPWYLYAVCAAATFVVVGITWDISWHMTIGRDTFWTPAHMCTYTAGVIVGITCGVVALRTTFRGTVDDRDRAVAFWGFRAPLGAWICVWGAFAMLTSAPFDNWWHDAFGLDVQILSPPHSLLGAGMMTIVAGALVWTLAWQNRTEAAIVKRRLELLFAYSGGLLIAMMAILVYEYSYRGLQHGSTFYRISAIAFPALMIAVARGSTMRWPATTATLVYMAARIIMGWILPLFPGSPRLGPIYDPLTHMAALEFPLLLVGPGIATDALMHAFGKGTSQRRDWLLAPVYGVAFVLALLIVQWPFADFLHSPAARNWLFFADRNFSFSSRAGGAYRQYQYFRGDASVAAFARGILMAMLFATVTARVGLGIGAWMRRVRR